MKQTRVGNSGIRKPLAEVSYFISFVGVFGGSNNIGTLAGINFVECIRGAPEQNPVTVLPGETSLAFYKARRRISLPSRSLHISQK